MGVIKNRMKQVFMGQVQFQNVITMKANSSGSQFFGVKAISSGQIYNPVSTSVVKSDDAILLTPMFTSSYAVQNSMGILAVTSVVEGSGFQIVFTNGGFYGNAGLKAVWEIRRIGS